MNLKREIKQAIGPTKEHEENVWQKLTQRQRKKRYPLFISIATAALACVILAISLWPANTAEQAKPVDQSQDETFKGQPFVVRHDQDGSTWNIEHGEFVLTATNQQELNHWLKYLEIDSPGVSFDGYFVLIAQFYSDGCGLVVENLQPSDETLNIRLDLPPDLRSSICTMQELANIQILQVPEFQGYQELTTAKFTGLGDNKTVAINELKINDLYYNFGLAHDYVLLDKVIVNDIKTSQQFVLQNEDSLQTLSNSIFRSAKLEGLVDMIDPDYRIVIQHESGEQLSIQLWTDNYNKQVIFVSEKQTEQAFKLTGEYAQYLIELLKP